MASVRQIHNPGTVLLLHTTADAYRTIVHSLRESATTAAGRCVDARAQEGPDSTRGAIFAESARRCKVLADEIAHAMNVTPSTVFVGFTPDSVLIGRGLEAVRLAEWHADLEELDRRARRSVDPAG